MTRLITISILAILTQVASAQIKFDKSFKSAQEKALKSNSKYIFIDFTAKWCGPCKQMDKKVFSKADVGDYVNSRFSPLRIDIDTPEGEELVHKYSIEQIPTILILDTKGNVIKRLEGYHTDMELLKELKLI